MIDYLRGILLERQGNHIVHEEHGVGYGLVVPASTAERCGPLGGPLALWVRTWVREDILRLYGFLTRYERDVFDLFVEISGVGPGIGLAILSAMSIPEIVQAAITGDAMRFKRIKGVGQKMADKLILELKGRTDRLAAGLPPEALIVAAGSSIIPEPRGEAARDAVAVLEALEVRPQQARRAVALALESLGSDATTEDLVREGLKHRRAAS